MLKKPRNTTAVSKSGMCNEGSRATMLLEAVSEKLFTVFAAAVDSDQKSTTTDEMKKRAPLKKKSHEYFDLAVILSRGTRHTVQTDGTNTITQAPQRERWSVLRNLCSKKQME
jgi:hypothetical protein